MKKKIACLLLILLLLPVVQAGAVSEYPAQTPYETYIYGVNDTPYVIPAAYQVSQVLLGSDMGADDFKELTDVYCDNDGTLYFCDAGNHAIVITDASFQQQGILKTFENGGKTDGFSSPSGVCADDRHIYVADTGNSRIVVFDKKTRSLNRVLNRPSISLLADDYTYSPAKVAVDEAGRLYVIAGGINQGLIELDENGAFSTFLGAPSVQPDLLEQVWRRFATKEQLAQMDKYVPTEYNALLIDENGFIYATSKSSETAPLVKLNNNGNDVLDFADPFGDEDYEVDGESSRPYFADVAVGPGGTYALIDSQRGRLYLYTGDGELMFAFGTNGSQDGTFYSASAVEFADNAILVTDSAKNTVTVLRPTAFGLSTLEAVEADRAGRYEEAYSLWETVLARCSHYPLAVLGMAKVDIQQARYTQAMGRLAPLHEMEYYDQAVTGWRDAIIRRQFGWLLLAAAAVAGALLVVPRLVRRTALYKKISGTQACRQYAYGSHVMLHPFDGFWDIKREKKGGMKGALLLLAAFILLYALRAQFSGFLASGVASSEVNALYECVMILIPLGLWVVANWCFTTLMDGEGSMKDIFIATCYALKPYVVMSLPLLALSHLLVGKEMVFYTLGSQICLIWVLGLLFFGMMTTHNYSLSKGILTLLLTLVGMCLLIFIALLSLHVVQDTVAFFRDIYQEITFRTY